MKFPFFFTKKDKKTGGYQGYFSSIGVNRAVDLLLIYPGTFRIIK